MGDYGILNGYNGMFGLPAMMDMKNYFPINLNRINVRLLRKRKFRNIEYV